MLGLTKMNPEHLKHFAAMTFYLGFHNNTREVPFLDEEALFNSISFIIVFCDQAKCFTLYD